MVRAKFKVGLIESTLTMKNVRKDEKGADVYENVEMRTIVMSPVYSAVPGSENKKFWDASPAGEIRLGTVNPGAWRQFELGKEYYVDFTPAANTEKTGDDWLAGR